MVIRAPNHLGDFVMALPALAAVPDAAVVVPRWLEPLALLLEREGPVIAFDRGAAGLLAAARALRAERCAQGVLLPPSFSSALMLRLAGVRRLRGAATDGRRVLLSEAWPRQRLAGRHRTAVYFELVTGEAPAQPPVPVLPVAAELREAWRRQAGLAAVGAGAAGAAAPAVPRLVGIFPGSNATSRRWDADRYAALAAGLAADGARVVVFGASGEQDLTRLVAAGAGDAGIDMGGRTGLPVLAAALAECDILVTNDSGPMHLAAAVGTSTLVVSGAADTRETAPSGSGHVYLQRLDLPCVPCVRNECPRSGAGYILPEAERECLRLIQVQDVLNAARRMLRS
jgi:heptosyltransferase II